jgi:ABC-type proline/glycine betaine transport system permease subunit
MLAGALPAAALAIFLHFVFGLFSRVAAPIGINYAAAK